MATAPASRPPGVPHGAGTAAVGGADGGPGGAAAGGPASLRRVERAVGRLTTAAVQEMDDRLPWFRDLPAEHRSWITGVAHSGITSLLSWLHQPGTVPGAEIFRSAPRALMRSVSLAQTVEMVRVTVEVVEAQVPALAAPGEEALLREAVLRFSREIAFGAAVVYARAAEARGAWDARLEALFVDALLRGEPPEGLQSRASALGWAPGTHACVAVGRCPPADPQDPEEVVDAAHRLAHTQGVPLLASLQGHRLVLVVGGPDPAGAARRLAGVFAAGPVVLGPVVADLAHAARSAAGAVSGLRAVAGWPQAPRPVDADDLLPERALTGDHEARRMLVQQVYLPLSRAGGDLLDTVAAYLDHGHGTEAAARSLFVHPNTVRYRLRRVADVTGMAPTDSRHAYALRTAITLGRLDDGPSGL